MNMWILFRKLQAWTFELFPLTRFACSASSEFPLSNQQLSYLFTKLFFPYQQVLPVDSPYQSNPSRSFPLIDLWYLTCCRITAWDSQNQLKSLGKKHIQNIIISIVALCISSFQFIWSIHPLNWIWKSNSKCKTF